MRVVFMGTPDIAATCLKKILADGFDVVGVYTPPDRPKGRGMKLVASPVKELALANNIPVFQPENFRADEDVQVLIDRHFSPPKRALFQKEAVLHDLTSSPFFLIEDTSNFADLTADTLSITEKSHLLPTVKIKNKRSFRGNMKRLTWYDEAFGASRASLFYNCQSACEEIADKGENVPELFEWFKEQNQFFSGSMLGDASLVNPAGEVGLYE